MTDGDSDPQPEPARRRPSGLRKLGGAAMLGLGRALGEIYDPKPPTDTEIEQEASNDELDPDRPVRVELGDSPATSVARVRRS